MSNKLSSFLIKSNSTVEKSYCKKYGIELARLPNGVTILGIPCRKDSVFWAHIKYDFSMGAYGNNVASAHFLEHFINKRTRWLAEHNSLEITAHTGQLETEEEVSGIANPNAEDYGIWTVLGEIRKSLQAPLMTVSDIESAIETEKRVIKAEIKMKDGNHDWQCDRHFRKVVYSNKNPLQDSAFVLGSETDVDMLSRDVLEGTQSKVFSAPNLLISFYTEGELSISNKLMGELKSQFLDYPSSGRYKIDRSLLELINSDFEPGKVYRFDTELKNGIVTNEFVWIFKHNFPSSEYFGLNILRQAIHTELFSHSRKNGWGYFTNVVLTRPTDNVTFVRLRVDSRKDNQSELSNGITEVLSSVRSVASDIVTNERKRQLATPVNLITRLSWAVDGIKDNNGIINADLVREMLLEVNAEDLTNLIDKMLQTKPVLVVTGDLK